MSPSEDHGHPKSPCCQASAFHFDVLTPCERELETSCRPVFSLDDRLAGAAPNGGLPKLTISPSHRFSFPSRVQDREDFHVVVAARGGVRVARRVFPETTETFRMRALWIRTAGRPLW